MTAQDVRDHIVAVLDGARMRGDDSLDQIHPVSETPHVLSVETAAGEMFFVEVMPA